MLQETSSTKSSTAPSGVATGGYGLSPEQITAYRENGFVFPFNALSATETAGYLARLESFEAEYGARADQVLRQKSHLVLSFMDDLIRLKPVLDTVESLIGPDILCWSTSFFIKNPNDKKFISWHQDVKYWGLEADDIVSAWIALTPSNPRNGCMRVVPRSHLTLLTHQDSDNPDNMLTRGQEVAAEVDETQAVDLTLAPGQFSLHHERTIHGSNPNRGTERRIGLSIRYLRPTARQVVESSDTASLVRGVDRYGHFAAEPRPRTDMEPANVDYLEALLSKRANGAFRASRK